MPKSSRQHIVNRVHEDAETTPSQWRLARPILAVAGGILRIDRRNVLTPTPPGREPKPLTVAGFAAPALDPSAPPTLDDP